mmetsp:Transcript_10909/g.15721  ORF Transcript_10909/g.15721 Transcript_10909/m.15721 type:complete len:141 (-) Transcript_10909:133-555(-)
MESIRFSIWADSTLFGENVGNTSEGPNEKWRNQELDILVRSSGEYEIVLERDNQGIAGLQSSGVRADECSLYPAADIPAFVGSDSVNYGDPMEQSSRANPFYSTSPENSANLGGSRSSIPGRSRRGPAPPIRRMFVSKVH